MACRRYGCLILRLFVILWYVLRACVWCVVLKKPCACLLMFVCCSLSCPSFVCVWCVFCLLVFVLRCVFVLGLFIVCCGIVCLFISCVFVCCYVCGCVFGAVVFLLVYVCVACCLSLLCYVAVV